MGMAFDMGDEKEDRPLQGVGRIDFEMASTDPSRSEKQVEGWLPVKNISRIFLLSALCALTIVSHTFSAQAQTPQLVFSDSLTASSEPGNGFKFVYGGSMGTGTLAQNLLTLRITAPHGSVISSITDNQGSTYTLGTSADSGVAAGSLRSTTRPG